ncbi:hypothetical protein [Vibrio caribbeanicus]|uniref:Uncharacterized protein n=1 Tax=Vibrio caribbeanicus ATCC BAA-2122 TaxID=796620 RepID=E3BI02_9VIBR|nr:hypothetical protein [Vibrio caribbeanicus]EFP97441.1 hypothetical protein VIBC2010_18659 [Vibrio caribbeanicus ATCC BAA-2122]
MPLIIALPLLAGGVGFGTGFWSGSSATKIFKAAALGGGAYMAYRVVKGSK